MQIPSKVKIGPIIYHVEEVNGLRDGDTKLDGHIRYSDCKILIEEELDPMVKRVVFVHEFLHGILTQASIEHTESLIDVLAYGIVDVLDNGMIP